MVSQFNKKDCSGCGSCQFICPQQCIVMKRDEEGFLYPEINEENCSGCNLCETSCPEVQYENYRSASNSIAAYNLNETVRRKSSSGGIFWLLAETVIRENGTVYGVVCNVNHTVCHSRATTMEQVEPMLGSKYVQSDPGNTYIEAADDLKEGKKVLYSGTPCQIAGLMKVLQKEKADTSKLVTVDMVCHGVPSPKVWEYYCNTKILKENEKIKKVNFRDKSTGWKCYSLSIETNKKKYSRDIRQDSFMISFLKNFSLRPSCYACHFKGLDRRVSDITLADFWGVSQEISNYVDDDKGISWVTINSDKGEGFIQTIESAIWYQKVEIEKGIRHNYSAIRPSFMPKGRRKFFKEIEKKTDFEKLTLQCAGETGIVGILKKIKRRIMR